MLLIVIILMTVTKEMQNDTIEKVIDLADELGICKKDDRFNEFIDANEYLYERVKRLQYLEFQNLFNYIEGYTPFSTQHKVKGAEFDNVLVILDNGKWNNIILKIYLLVLEVKAYEKNTENILCVLYKSKRKIICILL